MNSSERSESSPLEPQYSTEPYGEHHTLFTSLKTSARNIIPNRPLDLPERTPSEERLSEPDATAVVESLRKRVVARLKSITARN